MNPRFTTTLAVLLLITLGAPTWCWAQEESEVPQIDWFEVRTIQVKADMVDQWRELQRDGINEGLKKAGTPFRGAWRAVFGTNYQWTFVTPIESFAKYHQSQIEFAEGVSEKVEQCHVARRVEAVTFRRDLSKERDPSTPLKLAVVSVVQIAPGRSAEYADHIKTHILPAMEKVGVDGYEVYSSVFGGPVTWHLVIFFSDMAEIDKGSPLRRAVGREKAAEINAMTAGIVTSVERALMSYDEELSYSTAAPSSDN